jgi:hypothetical protein
MNDEELMKMAAFKVRESATRLAVLGRQLQSQAARIKVRSVYRLLMQKEAMLMSTAASLHALEPTRARPSLVVAAPGRG